VAFFPFVSVFFNSIGRGRVDQSTFFLLIFNDFKSIGFYFVIASEWTVVREGWRGLVVLQSLTMLRLVSCDVVTISNNLFSFRTLLFYVVCQLFFFFFCVLVFFFFFLLVFSGVLQKGQCGTGEERQNDFGAACRRRQTARARGEAPAAWYERFFFFFFFFFVVSFVWWDRTMS
jgi:hypothetical protein